MRHIHCMHSSEPVSTPAENDALFSLTKSAASRINALKNKDNRSNLRFRVVVKGGGCSGFQYEFSLDSAPLEASDSVFMLDGAEVVVDDVSLGLVSGSQLDFVEDLSQAGFEIKNPKATAKCGCGNSFSVNL